MKHFILATLMAAALVSSGIAQNVICNPNNSPSLGPPNLFPFGTQTDWRFSFIIDAAVLGSSPLKITDIAFASSSTAVWTAKQLQIRMNHTNASGYAAITPPSFDTVLGRSPTIVHDGPITWKTTANAWSPIGLTGHFGYDGSRSICCEIRYQSRGAVGVQTRVFSGIKRAFTNNRYSADPYNDPLWHTPIPGENSGPRHCLTIDRTNVLLADDAVATGKTARIRIVNATSAGDSIQVAASLGQSLLVSEAGCLINLDADAVFFASVLGREPTIFGGYAGTVGKGGDFTATFSPPSLGSLVGLSVYHAAVIHDANGMNGCTNTDGTLITR